MKFFAVLVSACIVLSGINVAEARRGGGSRTKSTTKTITTTRTANHASHTSHSKGSAQGGTNQQCGTKRYCSQMSSCSEAKYYLNTCGVSSLDRNNDGVPCESLCK
ncbi:MAG: excalibur calcium-binding domain-containing protein [Moraxella sp.]